MPPEGQEPQSLGGGPAEQEEDLVCRAKGLTQCGRQPALPQRREPPVGHTECLFPTPKWQGLGASGTGSRSLDRAAQSEGLSGTPAHAGVPCAPRAHAAPS